MSPNQAAYLCLVLAFTMSNLPFACGLPAPARLAAAQSKRTALRIMLWLILYVAWVAIAMLLESNIGGLTSKDWSIWPISIAFFAVLAFPGIVYRYLWRPGPRRR